MSSTNFTWTLHLKLQYADNHLLLLSHAQRKTDPPLDASPGLQICPALLQRPHNFSLLQHQTMQQQDALKEKNIHIHTTRKKYKPGMLCRKRLSISYKLSILNENRMMWNRTEWNKHCSPKSLGNVFTSYELGSPLPIAVTPDTMIRYNNSYSKSVSLAENLLGSLSLNFKNQLRSKCQPKA